MSVHPIEFRYFSEEMRSLFTEEARLQYWLTVEAALASAHAALGHIPVSAAEEITQKASAGIVKVDRVKAIEAEIQHDLMAMVKALTEVCGPEAGKYIHLGATSYDIEDTALALQLGAALDLIEQDLIAVRAALAAKAQNTKHLVCIGRTHGQQAVPTTYGLKFAIYASEFHRHVERLRQLRPRLKVGKMSGAVGTQAGFGKDAQELQRRVMAELGLEHALVSNQIVQRDRHAEAISLLALIAASSEKIALELRNLQRTEIGEVWESFSSRQVGSSTMPHKRNPHKSERICSLARVLRGHLAPAFENVALEHERDLTNSAAERIIFPESFIICDYMLRQLADVLERLVFDEANIRANLERTGGLIMCESLMLALVERGMGRQEAHELLRVAAQEAFSAKLPLKSVLLRNDQIRGRISEADLDKSLDPASYIGTAVKQVESVLALISQPDTGA